LVSAPANDHPALVAERLQYVAPRGRGNAPRTGKTGFPDKKLENRVQQLIVAKLIA
jgi:hypothetical protein